jgi:hypothetical protein
LRSQKLVPSADADGQKPSVLGVAALELRWEGGRSEKYSSKLMLIHENARIQRNDNVGHTPVRERSRNSQLFLVPKSEQKEKEGRKGFRALFAMRHKGKKGTRILLGEERTELGERERGGAVDNI